MGRVCVCGAVIALLLCSTSGGFTPLGFRALLDIEMGRVFAWPGEEPGAPLHLSFAVEDDFLIGAGVDPEAARQAAVNALQTWSDGLGGFIEFSEADWSAVPNAGDGPPFEWEGPGFDEWFEDYLLPEEERRWPDERAGWGANIDIFSRPAGFEIVSAGQLHEMTPTRLGFAVINKSGQEILSVDIYLNKDFDWSTTGSGGFDVESVLLHEIGHGLGFDHPAEAVSQGSVNLSPETFLPGYEWSAADVMHPAYTGVKRDLTIDEIGGLLFLYTDQVDGCGTPGDLNGDGIVNVFDLSILLSFWGMEYPPADLNGSGVVDAPDLGDLLSLWSSGDAPPTVQAPPPPGQEEPRDSESSERACCDSARMGQRID